MLYPNENILREFHGIYADLISIRNPKSDDKSNWYEAKRIIGYKCADDIINSCKSCNTKQSNCHLFPTHYYDYLNSLSVDEFKKMKAYFIWKKNGGEISNEKSKIDKDYLDACNEITFLVKSNKTKKKSINIPLPNHTVNYINDINLVDANKITKRKAFWNYLETMNCDSDYNWKCAEKFVTQLYQKLRDNDSNASLELCELLDKNHHIVNMFEFCLRCYLLQSCGLTILDLYNKKQI